ncbi:hypothetical protein [Mesorhizobium argentiipisi]|uniref:Uncharacterized protein n=1 Tax=Mesorhizobium argentiipisi TaxID=3015175 RepID=A0ABU8KI95_9HYPH
MSRYLGEDKPELRARLERAASCWTCALAAAAKDATTDQGRPARQYLFDLLLKPGEENLFRLDANPATRTYHLPLMPLLAGDNPITNKQ